MTQPGQPGPPPRQPGNNSSQMVLMIVLSVGGVSLLLCGVSCAGLAYLVGGSKTVVQQMKATVENRVNPPIVAPQWAQDWVTMEHLTRVYTMSLDTVIEDKQVRAKLGDSIEPVNEPDKLFRREKEGPFSGETEIIEYEVQGSKGEAVVRVEGGGPGRPPGMNSHFRPTKITVKLSDGTEIDVPPPKEESEPEP